MLTESQKKANKKYIDEKTDTIYLREKGVKQKIKKAADKRNLSVTAFIIQCVNDKLPSDWIDYILADTATEDKPQPAEKTRGMRIPLPSNEKLKEAGYNISIKYFK